MNNCVTPRDRAKSSKVSLAGSSPFQNLDRRPSGARERQLRVERRLIRGGEICGWFTYASNEFAVESLRNPARRLHHPATLARGVMHTRIRSCAPKMLPDAVPLQICRELMVDHIGRQHAVRESRAACMPTCRRSLARLGRRVHDFDLVGALA